MITEHICMYKMKRFTFYFIILSGLLFAGIAIMVKPTAFVPTTVSYQASSPEQPLAGRIVPREIIILGSALTILGLVGLSILGFRIFKESDREATRSD